MYNIICNRYTNLLRRKLSSLGTFVDYYFKCIVSLYLYYFTNRLTMANFIINFIKGDSPQINVLWFIRQDRLWSKIIK